MAGINKVILVGNLGKDPEVRHLEGGNSVANFTLATNDYYKDKQGNRVERTEWHNISAWRGLAEASGWPSPPCRPSSPRAWRSWRATSIRCHRPPRRSGSCHWRGRRLPRIPGAIVALFAGTAVAIVAGLVLARSIVGSVDRVRDASTALAQGDLSVRAPESGPAEVADLAASFNAMAAGLEQLFDARRELVAWASHDLRTPLANMQAMLEALEDGLVEPEQTLQVEVAGKLR